MSPDRFRLSLASAPARPSALPIWRQLLELGGRLPGGLVHAERITFVPSPPPFLEPLGEGSRWFALGHGLVVTAELDGEGVSGVMADLQAYRGYGTLLQGRFSDWPDAAAQLERPELPIALALALGPLLEASPQELLVLDRRAPGLRADLAGLLRRGFDPELVIHPALSEVRQREAGATLAESLLARIPAGRFHLLITDRPSPVELLSPFAQDLGHSLYQWGLENTERLTVVGLADALRVSQAAPQRDLAAGVAPSLMAAAGDEILVERRDNEASQGLWLEDAWGATWGIADLGRLEGADPAVRRHETTDVLALVAGGSGVLRLAAAGRLAASGRLEGLAICACASMKGSLPIVPEALTWHDDAIRLELSTSLVRLAQKMGIAAQRLGALSVGAQGAPEWVAGVLRLWRLARITGSLDAQGKPMVVLAPTSSQPDLHEMKVGLDAGRLVLAGLLDPELIRKQNTGKTTGGPRSSGVSRRFRA